jgi:hypothetical protein
MRVNFGLFKRRWYTTYPSTYWVLSIYSAQNITAGMGTSRPMLCGSRIDAQF